MSIHERWKDDGNFAESTPLDPVTEKPISTPEKPLTSEQVDRFTAIQEAWELHDRTGDRSGLIKLGILPAEDSGNSE